MIEAVKQQVDMVLSNYVRLEQEEGAGQPAWLRQLRKSAWLRFSELGFPTPRQEEWRFTSLAPITGTDFQLDGRDAGLPSPEQLNALQFADLECPRLVFVNGRFSGELSTAGDLPAGIRFSSLAQAIEEVPGLVQEHLGRYVRYEEQPFNALNTAMISQGAFIHAEPGKIFDQPLHLLFVHTPTEHPLASHPRILIVAEENSQLSIVESHLGSGQGVYLTNPITEIAAADNSVVDHYKLQRESNQAFHIGTVQAYQTRQTSVRTTTITLSGSIVRNETNTYLDGEGGWGNLNGLFLVAGSNHVDNFTTLEHARPHCDSREVYRGILEEKGRGVFRGRIIVQKGAQKTDSKQTNRNLLLSDEALINTKPQLEIYADDVKCTHGATIGQLEDEALFYLRSRGIDEKAARSILIYAFASELVNEIKVEALRRRLDNYLFEWLPRGELVREAV